MIGAPLATVLQSKGLPLVVYNRKPAKGSTLVRAGAALAASPEEVARQADSGVVFVCVSDYPACRAVMTGRRGLSRAMRRGSVIVNLSTISPVEARHLARSVHSKGIGYVDSPIGGSIDAAARGEVMFYVGAGSSDLAKAKKYLSLMSREILRLGPVGQGSAMKLVNNFLTISTVAMDAEALSLAEGLGLPLRTSVDILLKGGGRSQMLINKKDLMISGDYTPRFLLRLALKDLRLVEATARGARRKVTLASAARRLMREGVAQGRGEEDFSAVFEVVRTRSRSA